MNIKKIILPKLLTLSMLFYWSLGHSFSFDQKAYLGILGGYGSTTWDGLVPTKENQNAALNISTPIKVTEGGGVWGFWAGYEFMPVFALELTYLGFPKAKVFFDSLSFFSFENNELVKFDTKTELVGLMAKIMLPVSTSPFRLYSSIGGAAVHRQDILANHWRLSPTFGAGVNYAFNKHLMAEIGGNYTAGYGESQLSPSETYFPFLYSITARLAYRF